MRRLGLRLGRSLALPTQDQQGLSRMGKWRPPLSILCILCILVEPVLSVRPYADSRFFRDERELFGPEGPGFFAPAPPFGMAERSGRAFFSMTLGVIL